MELLTIVYRYVVGMIPAPIVAVRMTAAIIVNWVTPVRFGLPLVQITHGAWILTMLACARAIRLTTSTVSVVSGRKKSIIYSRALIFVIASSNESVLKRSFPDLSMTKIMGRVTSPDFSTTPNFLPTTEYLSKTVSKENLFCLK